MGSEKGVDQATDAEMYEIIRKLVLEGRHSYIVVLVFLDKVGKATLSDIQRALAGGKYRAQYNWTLSILNELKNLNLVYEDQILIKQKFKIRLYDLTEKGKKIAEKLSEILQV